MRLSSRGAALAVAAWAAGAARGLALEPLATASTGSVPGAINYQGRLEDQGFPVTGVRQVSFRVYDAASGGALLWNGGAQSVAFQGGFFNASLAVSTAALTGGGERFLEVQVDSVLLSPRQKLDVKSYALVARTIEGSLDVSGAGLSVSSSPGGGSSLYISSLTARVGVMTSDPRSVLDVRGVIGGGGSSGLFAAAGGNVGVSTAAPASTMTVVGDLRVTGGLTRGILFPGDAAPMVSALVAAPAALTSLAHVTVMSDSDADGAGAVVAQTGASERLRLARGGRVGLGSSEPAALLHLSSGAWTLDGVGSGLAVGASAFSVSAGSVGVATLRPSLPLDVEGGASFGLGAAKSTFSAAGLVLAVPAVVTSSGTLSLSTAATAAATGAPALFADAAARIGVGTGRPAARLDVAGSLRAGSASGRAGFDEAGNLFFTNGGLLTGAGRLFFSTAAAADEPALYAAAGRVGLGTTAPGSVLAVHNGDITISTASGSRGIGFPDGSTQTLASGAAQWACFGPPLTCDVVSTGRGRIIIGDTDGVARLDVKEPTLLEAFSFRASSGPAAYTLAVTTGGRVGLGSSQPAAALHLDNGDDAYTGLNAAHDLSAGEDFFVSGGLVLDADVRVEQAAKRALLASVGIGLSPAAAQLLAVGPAQLSVLNTGRVGFGTSGPAAALAIGGSGSGTGNTAMAQFSSGQWAFKLNAGDFINAGILDYRGIDVEAFSFLGAGTGAANRRVRIYDTLTLGFGPPAGGVAAFNGNVGVGGTDPGSPLDVRGVIGGGGAQGVSVGAGGNVGLGTTVPQSLLDVRGYITTSGGATGIVIDSSGRVGIGTTGPGALLDASGAVTGGVRYIKTGSADARITLGDPTRSWSLGEGSSAAGDSSIVEEGGGVDNILFRTGGRVGIGVSAPANVLSVAGAASFGGVGTVATVTPETQGAGSGWAFYDRTGGAGERWAIYSDRISGPGTNTLRLWNPAQGDVVSVQTGPAVGVGTSDAAAALDIVNSASDTLVLRKTDGVAGSVELFAAVGDGTSRAGVAVCNLAAYGADDAVCLGYFDPLGGITTCASSFSNGRALCADFGD